MDHELFTIREAARMAGVQAYRLRYAHETGAIPEPERWHGYRAYTGAEVEEIRRYFSSLPQVGRRGPKSLRPAPPAA